MTILLTANTIIFIVLFAIWSKDSWPNTIMKAGFAIAAVVNGVFAYRALDAIGFFTAVNG